MLLYATFRFHRWGALGGGALAMPDFPLLSKALLETEKAFSGAFSAAAAMSPPPPPGPQLLTRTHLCVSPGGAANSTGTLKHAAERPPYYITTAIAYTNGTPHMGHAYEYLAADALARYHRLAGFNVKYVTGTDEHGMKIADAAANAGVPTQQFVDAHAAEFVELLRKLNSSHDQFVRTSSDEHKAVSQWLWKACRDKGDIYLGTYSGWYNRREEAFVSERDAKATDFKDPVTNKPLERMQEESYFFKMGRYQERLIEHIKSHPGFVAPVEKENEILRRLQEPLHDLSCSRASFTWGVPVPDDERHVMYVWFDALTNYLTGLNPLVSGSPEFRSLWPASLHLIGKDIIWFHCVIWPCMLMSAGLPLPKRVFAHGFVLGPEGEKMSKSLGNVVLPEDALAVCPADSFRFFLLRDARYGCDMRFDMSAMRATHNNELANTIGNLLQRLVGLTAKFCGGKVPPRNSAVPPRHPPFDLALLTAEVADAFRETALREALELPLQAVRDLNKFLTDTAPWACKDEERRQEDIRLCLECLYTLAHFLEPFLPEAMSTVFKQFNTKPKLIHELSPWMENLAPGTPIDPPEKVLFEPIPEEPATDEQQQQQSKKQHQKQQQQKQRK
ncbi:uncharacterized protein LOC34619189 [Cyclospora cayetanensis]|uniref:methionine--tRNA ligase n=1 Tax=Cyclospora cayetanensis TaxID=88456 RepID=A0A6P6S2J6_9EIME|nr:uncharacterized protein LOC34619189 [Cyclospora cayetanensis]